jgi:hypothetical protein
MKDLSHFPKTDTDSGKKPFSVCRTSFEKPVHFHKWKSPDRRRQELSTGFRLVVAGDAVLVPLTLHPLGSASIGWAPGLSIGVLTTGD